MDHLKTLHNEHKWDIKKLQLHFGISYTAVRKILRSKFEPTEEIRKRQDQRALELRNERKKNLTNSATAEVDNHNK